MALRKWWFSFMLVCLCHFYGAQSEPCTFPAFLQTAAGDPAFPWSASSPDRVYQFKGSNMTEAGVEWGIIGDDTTTYTCIEVGNDVYKISKNATEPSTCITFTRQTANVVRLAKATANFDKSCPKELPTQESVLVRLKTTTAVPSGGCALEGGFLFRSDDVTHPNVTNPACGHPLPGRLESECLPGEGVRLSFPDSKCVPSGTGWTTDQRLPCLESWTEESYNFTLLGGGSADQVQCMRITKDPQSFEIFSGTNCPAGAIQPGTQYTNFTIEDRPDFSGCEDDYAGCTEQFCTKYGEYCREKCKLCDEPKTCEFEDVVTTGKWLDAASNHTVDISKSEIVFADNMYANLACRKKVDPASYILQPKVQKTCRPRYTCGKFSRVSPPVLRYKLSQSLFDAISDITACGEGLFSDDPAPIGDTYRSRLYKNLIATDKTVLNQTSTCTLKGNFSISGLITEEQCIGNMSALNGCEASESIDLQMNCSSHRELKCLGEIPSDSFETKMMIVIPPGGDAKCWVIKGDERDAVTITSLYPAQCNEETPNKILLDPTYHLAGRLDASREDTCDGPLKTTPAPTTTAAATTSDETTSGTTSSSPPETTSTTQPNGTSIEPDTSPTTSTITEMTSEAPSTQTTAAPPTSPPGMSGGTVAAIVISVLILSAVLAAVLYYIYKKWRRRRVPYSSLT